MLFVGEKSIFVVRNGSDIIWITHLSNDNVRDYSGVINTTQYALQSV